MIHNILAVEDDPDALANLRDILELDGYHVTGVRTLEEATARSPWAEFSVILLDGQLPYGIADTILPQIHKTAPHVAVIIISDYADLNGTIAAIRAGAADYLLKPINPDLLRASITRALKMQAMEERTLQAERLVAIGDLLQTSPDAILWIDKDGRIRLMNEEAEKMFGYRTEELIGEPVEILVPEPSRTAHIGHRQRFFERPTTRPMKTRLNLFLRRKDGSELPVDICLGHRQVNGQEYAIASVRDITDRRRLEEELRVANAAIEDSYKRLRRDVEAAAQLQRQLLPTQLPSVVGIHFAWEYRPCAGLGGDGLNIFWLDDRHVGLYQLDVSGHGVAAAMLSVTLARLLLPTFNQSSFLRVRQSDEESTRIVPPAEVAQQLNQWLLINPTGEQFFTFLYGILEVRTHVLRYVSAGHPALLYAPSNSPTRLLRVPGYPIGCVESADFEENQLLLRSGDRLFMASDGLTEATCASGEQFGAERLQQVIETANREPLEACTQQLIREVLQWAGDPQDDLSVLALAIE